MQAKNFGNKVFFRHAVAAQSVHDFALCQAAFHCVCHKIVAAAFVGQKRCRSSNSKHFEMKHGQLEDMPAVCTQIA